MICRVCEAQYEAGHWDVRYEGHPGFQERIVPRDDSLCPDCNNAAEAHSRTVDQETKAEQMERRRKAFPRAFPGRSGAA